MDVKFFSVEHDYILCYAKDISFLKLNRDVIDVEKNKEYKYEDEFVGIRGRYKINKLDRGSIKSSKSLCYEIIAPDGTIIKNRRWKRRLVLEMV